MSGVADMEQSSSTDAKAPQTAKFFAQRSPVSTDAKVVQAEAVADMEQSSSTDVKVAQTGSYSVPRSPVSMAARVVQTEVADLEECPSTDGKLVHAQFVVQSEQHPMVSAAVAPCPAESAVDTLVAPETRRDEPWLGRFTAPKCESIFS